VIDAAVTSAKKEATPNQVIDAIACSSGGDKLRSTDDTALLASYGCPVHSQMIAVFTI
jgi:hypothetical protein